MTFALQSTKLLNLNAKIFLKSFHLLNVARKLLGLFASMLLSLISTGRFGVLTDNTRSAGREIAKLVLYVASGSPRGTKLSH